MKTAEEMAASVLRRRDEHLAKVRCKRRLWLRCGVLAACVAAVAGAGAVAWNKTQRDVPAVSEVEPFVSDVSAQSKEESTPEKETSWDETRAELLYEELRFLEKVPIGGKPGPWPGLPASMDSGEIYRKWIEEHPDPYSRWDQLTLGATRLEIIRMLHDGEPDFLYHTLVVPGASVEDAIPSVWRTVEMPNGETGYYFLFTAAELRALADKGFYLFYVGSGEGELPGADWYKTAEGMERVCEYYGDFIVGKKEMS